ncbi:MAG: Gfo/Idh/MocA family oxidoreductase [Acidobacteria bacterium]|nr:Gfo/Idh/MocA family oxidoreductase [Acidobacteriota bacterium]
MKIAVAGLGFMGSTHLTAWRNVPGAQLVAVVEEDAAKRSGDLSKNTGNLNREVAKLDFANVSQYAKLDEALADPGIEAIDLCLPTFVHEETAVAALRAGKHVLVEKPMALDGAACDRMMAEAAKSGRTLMCAQVLRFWGDYQPIIAGRRSGKLGNVRSALFRRRCAAPQWGRWLQDPHKGGGGIFDLLIHDVDMCVHLFGIPEAVSATGHEYMTKGIDVITAQLHYSGIPSVIVTGGWHHPASYPFSMEYTVTFDEATIEFSSLTGKPVAVFGDDGQERTPAEAGLPRPEKDGFQAELEYFTQCVTNGAAPTQCPPSESAAAVRIMRLLDEARKNNGDKLPCRF